MLLYLDTNIVLDVLLNRSFHSKELVQRALECEFTILTSEWVVKEASAYADSKQIRTFFSWLDFAEKLEIVPITRKMKKYARHLDTHYADALHCVAATQGNADAVVTWNVKDFAGIIACKTPDTI